LSLERPPERDPEQRGLVRENIAKGLVALVLFLLLLGVLGFFLEQELIDATNWLVAQIGFVGLCLVLFVTDSIVTPFPPDVLLLVIAKSHLAEHWLTYVATLGLVSVAAGCLGWAIGRGLGHTAWAERRLSQFKGEHGGFVRKYGFWAIVLGAVTPLPYSVTCWGAGVMGLRFTTVLWASLLFRVPRFVLYYWLIVNTGHLVNG